MADDNVFYLPVKADMRRVRAMLVDIVAVIDKYDDDDAESD